MKLWQKSYQTDNSIESFTTGNDGDLDLRLAEYDVIGSLAHAEMLWRIGILNEEEWQQVSVGLKEILTLVEHPSFQIPEEFEDIHSFVEITLTEKIGEAGKKLHTGRSRNDQVLVDLHLYVKDALTEIKKETSVLFETLMDLAEQNKEVLMPGYTHMQVAMPSSFGLWFGAYAECLIDDLVQLNATYAIADQNPLGSAAGYGTSIPLDREFTRQKLGFSTLRINSLAAQLSRGRLEKSVAFTLSSLASAIGKMAVDVCLYTGQNFGFFRLKKEFTTGSSIMPHKQNPDVFELVRAQCNKLRMMPSEIDAVCINLPSGYHRDFQVLKEILIHGVENMLDILRVFNHALTGLEISTEWMHDDRYRYLFSVEELNRLVASGMPFREAYQQISSDIELGRFQPAKEFSHSHLGSIGNLGLEEIRKKHLELLTAG